MNRTTRVVSDVGILGLEIYFPRMFVDQQNLEEFDEVSKGKYTIGLGQSKMGFCEDREDVNSLCLTAVKKLMEKMKIGCDQIGRLEVGTETLLDKSKSVKTVIMQLFEPSGNTDIEGVDTINACYGGTSALFNAISWIHSPFWDGRLALVVAADIAVYASGSARPTGGAGAVAMLVGPNAPIVFNKVRATHMAHVYDFYKPEMVSEYPYVDGKLSIECYLSALDHCYQLYSKKQKASTSSSVTVDYFDYFCFHAPYCKLVQKSLARLLLNDLVGTDDDTFSERFPELNQYRNVKLEETYFDRNLEQALISCSKAAFQSKTQPTLLLANVIGNMYTPSLYGGLISLLISQPGEKLLGRRIGMFSYGSGLASSMFSLTMTSDLDHLETLITSLSDVIPRLESRVSVPPRDFVEILKLKEETHHKAPYTPVGSVEALFPGTYYLVAVDSMHRRSYARKPIDGPTMTIE